MPDDVDNEGERSIWTNADLAPVPHGIFPQDSTMTQLSSPCIDTTALLDRRTWTAWNFVAYWIADCLNVKYVE